MLASIDCLKFFPEFQVWNYMYFLQEFKYLQDKQCITKQHIMTYSWSLRGVFGAVVKGPTDSTTSEQPNGQSSTTKGHTGTTNGQTSATSGQTNEQTSNTSKQKNTKSGKKSTKSVRRVLQVTRQVILKLNE